MTCLKIVLIGDTYTKRPLVFFCKFLFFFSFWHCGDVVGLKVPALDADHERQPDFSEGRDLKRLKTSVLSDLSCSL